MPIVLRQINTAHAAAYIRTADAPTKSMLRQAFARKGAELGVLVTSYTAYTFTEANDPVSMTGSSRMILDWLASIASPGAEPDEQSQSSDAADLDPHLLWADATAQVAIFGRLWATLVAYSSA